MRAQEVVREFVSDLRTEAFVTPMWVIAFFSIAWPLYKMVNGTEYWGNAAVGKVAWWWIISSLYFGAFVWLKFLVLRCGRNYLALLASGCIGVLGSAAVALRESQISGPTVQADMSYFVILVPTLILLSIVQAGLRMRERVLQKGGSKRVRR